jgi:hypothetical protein
MIKRLLVLILVVFALTTLLVGSVSANIPNEAGTVDGIAAWADKGMYVTSSTFSPWLWSHAESYIGTIGFTWWTVREYCPDTGEMPVNEQFIGDVDWNSNSYYAMKSHDFYSCRNNTTIELQNLGTHDFKQGTAIWQPLVNYVEYP